MQALSSHQTTLSSLAGRAPRPHPDVADASAAAGCGKAAAVEAGVATSCRQLRGLARDERLALSWTQESATRLHCGQSLMNAVLWPALILLLIFMVSPEKT